MLACASTSTSRVTIRPSIPCSRNATVFQTSRPLMDLTWFSHVLALPGTCRRANLVRPSSPPDSEYLVVAIRPCTSPMLTRTSVALSAMARLEASIMIRHVPLLTWTCLAVALHSLACRIAFRLRPPTKHSGTQERLPHLTRTTTCRRTSAGA